MIGRLETTAARARTRTSARATCPTSSTAAARVVHDGELIIPYAMSDYASTFATVPLDDVLNAMVRP